MKDVTILTSPNCGYCHSAKQLLQKHRIAYREVDLHRDGAEAQHLLAQSGRRTVPQIFLQQQPIGGYTELAALLASSEFDITQCNIL
ncbi:glutaredoxin family protein [Methylomarinum vadi]|uniref:glutaredoxin family protein n=1 Tax=Methylomarinum vadi TaxID=438855 RepID=UPI0004DF2C78|nr:glutaredoxin domain-containing protein [Methylomarinum vadi]